MVQIVSENIDAPIRYITDVSSLYFASILMGQTEGIIWGDQEKNPEFLLIWSEYQEGFQLMGNALNVKEWGTFHKWFMKVIIPFMRSKEIDVFEYGVDHEELSKMMEGVFWEKKIGCAKQKIFSYDYNSTVERVEVLGKYIFEKIDDRFFQTDYQNMSFITEEDEMAYGTIENYLKNGYGYAAILEKEIVSRAIMTCRYDDESNISVNTLQTHRNKRLSSYLVQKTVEETLSRNQTPIWDCTQDNIASEKTATRCGFKLIREDNIYWFSI